jgi:mRNA interferase MazF
MGLKKIPTTMAMRMSEALIPQQGDVWDVYFDPVVGREQGGRRPALVLSNAELNSLPSQLCIVIPITSRDRDILLHIPISPPEGGLRNQSVILCDQLRSVSHDHLKRFRGRVSEEVIQQAISIVGLMLDQPD